MKELKFTYMDYIDVTLKLKNKKTVLNGNSATGKSYLYSIIEQYKQEEKRKDIICLDVNNVDIDDTSNVIEKIKKLDDGIVVIDQADDILTDKNLYETIINDNKNYYIIMSRKYFTRYSQLAKTVISYNHIGLKYRLNII